MNIFKSPKKNKAVNFLKQPYPFYYSGEALWIICGLLFILSLLFNYYFEPFEVNVQEHKMDFFWISFIHALVPVLVLFSLSLFLKPTNTEETWVIKKEISFVLIFVTTVGLAQFLIRDIIYDNAYNWSFRYLYEEIRNTFLVGTLFILILVPLNFNRLNYKNNKNANALNTAQELLGPIANARIVITTKLKNESLHLDINNLLFVKAEGNYVELYLKDHKPNKVILRMTIKELASILRQYTNIVKTHRSYLVNKCHIINIAGNAQGFKLQLNYTDEIIPVSRNMIHKFNEEMKNN